MYQFHFQPIKSSCVWSSGLQAKIWRETLLVTLEVMERRKWKASISLHDHIARAANLRNDRHTSLYCFTISCFAAVAVFINGRSVMTVKGASLKEPFFSNSICSLTGSVSHFGHSHGISNFFVMISCHGDLWSVSYLWSYYYQKNSQLSIGSDHG